MHLTRLPIECKCQNEYLNVTVSIAPLRRLNCQTEESQKIHYSFKHASIQRTLHKFAIIIQEKRQFKKLHKLISLKHCIDVLFIYRLVIKFVSVFSLAIRIKEK